MYYIDNNMGPDIERRCMSIVILGCGFFALVSSQLFDKRPTIYDHVMYGQPSKANQIESELKIQTEYLPSSCKFDDDNFFGDRDGEIDELKEKLRGITVEEGDTVTVAFKILLDKDGSEVESSTKPGELGQEDNIEPAKFQVGSGLVIIGWDLGVRGMCIGEVRRLIVPPQLAYGSKGFPPKIPADASLEIETELLSVKKKDMVDYYFDFLHNLHVFAFLVLGMTFLIQGFNRSREAVARRALRDLKKQREAELEEEYEYEEEEESDEEEEDSEEEEDEDSEEEEDEEDDEDEEEEEQEEKKECVGITEEKER